MALEDPAETILIERISRICSNFSKKSLHKKNLQVDKKIAANKLAHMQDIG